MATRVADEPQNIAATNGAPAHDSTHPAPTQSGPDFCRATPAEVEKFIADHAPHFVGAPSVLGLTPQNTNDEVPAAAASSADDRQRTASGADATPDLAAFEAAHTINYSRTFVCNGTRAHLWRVMMRSVRQPPCHNVKNVQVKCEGLDYVYREMDITTPDHPDFSEHIKEKITWDEANENVRSTLYDDEVKEGYVEKAITTDASAHVCLTVSCNWIFHPSPELTMEKLTLWRVRMKSALDLACSATIRAVEEEVKEELKQRRSRHASFTKDGQAPLHLSVNAAAAHSHESGKASPRQASGVHSVKQH